MSKRKPPASKRPKKDAARSDATTTHVQLSTSKKTVFAVIAVTGFFLLCEVLLWLAGVQPLFSQEDPYVGFSSQIPLLTEQRDGDQVFMQTARNKLPWFNSQRFPKTKPPNTYRVFTLGGSTTYGRPFNDSTSFSGWLREFLRESQPQRQWEVINAGGISYASYRVLRVMEELAEFEPDLFVVYTGHNEFLEDRTYRDVKRTSSLRRTITAWLSHTRLYSVLYRWRHDVGESAPKAGDTNEEPSSDATEIELSGEVLTRLDRGVGPDAYHRDDELRDDILEHFEYNLTQMIDVARRVNAELLLVVPASNLADCTPFKSEHVAGIAATDDWQRAFDAAQDAFARNDQQVALDAIEQAVQLAPRHALTQFWHGRILQALKRHDQAREAFTRARDEDVCPLRSLSATADIVRRVAREQDVSLIDFERLVRERSPDQIAGASLFLDHVHPTVEGHRLLALQLLDSLVDSGVAEPLADREPLIARVRERVESGIDRKAQGNALRNLAKVLNWAGKKEEADQLALQAAELLENDPEAIYLAGNALLEQGKVDEAIEHFQQALATNPRNAELHNSLGSALLRMSQLDEAEQHLLQAIELKPDLGAARNNLGAIYQQRGELDQAAEQYQAAIKLNPRYSKAFNNLGAICRTREQWEEAEQYFTKALEIDPEFAEAHYNLGTVLEHQGRVEDATLRYQQALRANPRYAPAAYGLGLLLEQRGQWRAAAQSYRQAMNAPQPFYPAAVRLAWLLAASPDNSLRNGKVALSLAQQCVTRSQQQDPEALSVLAAAHAELGDFAQAVRLQTSVVERLSSGDSGWARHTQRLAELHAGRPLRASADFSAGLSEKN